jgi:hydroxyacylglutathione hydrolase
MDLSRGLGDVYKRQVLIHSIKQKLMLLPDDVKVYSGHGSMTTIGFERSHNPFLKE